MTELGIILAHGQCEEMSPLFLDAYVGQYYDNTRVIFQNRQLPRCSNGTKIFYSLLPLSEPSNRLRPAHSLYDFHKTDPNVKDLSRVIRLVFKGEGIGRLSIGKIEIYGNYVQPLVSPQEEFNLFKQKRANNMIDSIIQSLNDDSSTRSTTSIENYAQNHFSDTDVEEYVTISVNPDSTEQQMVVHDEELHSTEINESASSFLPFRNSLFAPKKKQMGNRQTSPIHGIVSSPKRVSTFLIPEEQPRNIYSL